MFSKFKQTIKTNTMTPDQHLQAAKEAVAKKYGAIAFDAINFYQIDEQLQTTSPPFAEERITEEMILLALTNQAEELRKDNDFIMSALNHYWNDAHTKLQRRDLGDIERDMYDKQKKRAKEIMDKIEPHP